jgi:hypothetical protein
MPEKGIGRHEGDEYETRRRHRHGDCVLHRQ